MAPRPGHSTIVCYLFYAAIAVLSPGVYGQTSLRKLGELELHLSGLSATADPTSVTVPKNTTSGVRVSIAIPAGNARTVTVLLFTSTADWVGEIQWESRMTTDPVAMATRLPEAITRMDKAGATHTDSALNDTTPASADVITISSRATQQLIATCNDPCLPDGRTLLGLWWSIPTVAATP